ncbi:MAG: carbohydrate ABC transporter permease [Nocardioidaceae bacterium]
MPDVTTGAPALGGRRSHVTAYLFLLPGLLLFAGLIMWPVVQSLRMSFLDWKFAPGAVSPFVGLGNYQRAIEDPDFWKSLVNSLVYMLATVPIQMAIGLLVAVLIHKAIVGRVTFRALYYLPVVTSWVVVSLVFEYLFSTDTGLVNHTLHNVLGVGDEPVNWLGSRWTALVVLCLLGIWKGVGWSMLIFLAGLQNVPNDLLDAAAVDGAGPIRRFFAVTLPYLRPVILFVTVMLVIGGFNVFISVYVITGGGPANETQVVLTYMYQQAFEFLEFGYGSAIAYLLAIIIFGLSFAQMKLFRYDEGVDQ